jgi:hypothetical protein
MKKIIQLIVLLGLPLLFLACGGEGDEEAELAQEESMETNAQALKSGEVERPRPGGYNSGNSIASTRASEMGAAISARNKAIWRDCENKMRASQEKHKGTGWLGRDWND